MLLAAELGKLAWPLITGIAPVTPTGVIFFTADGKGTTSSGLRHHSALVRCYPRRQLFSHKSGHIPYPEWDYSVFLVGDDEAVKVRSTIIVCYHGGFCMLQAGMVIALYRKSKTLL